MLRAAQMELTDRDLAAMAGPFGLNELTSLGGFENAVYRAERPEPHILRITHTSRRTTSQVDAEMIFLRELEAASVPVAAPIETKDGELVVAHDTERSGTVTAVATRVAPGNHRSFEEWTDTDLRTYGELLGSLHAVAAALPRLDRPDWDETILPVVSHDLGGKHPAILAAVEEVLGDLDAHPAGARDLLVHEDPHLGNLFITDEGDITLFDFDDCGYGSATFDLAMVLLYWMAGRPLPDPDAEVRRLARPFLEGYTQHHALEEDWQQGADLHMRLRELELYAALVDTDLEGGWDAAFMQGRRERIEARQPFLGAPLSDLL